jgi:predicted nuclease of predicted toxin-antitoxin system
LKFLIDANLPPALAQWLAEDGHDAVYVHDLLAAPADDDAIWVLAAQTTRVVISKDSDFAQRVVRDAAVQVVWVRCGNLKLSVFRPWFAARLDAMCALLDLGERGVELQ